MEATQSNSYGVKPDPEGNGPPPGGPSGNRGDGDALEITIKSQDQGEVKFRVKSKTPFQKVFNAWARKKAVTMEHYRFLNPEGNRINAHETPADIGLEDGDSIDAMIAQEGGYCA